MAKPFQIGKHADHLGFKPGQILKKLLFRCWSHEISSSGWAWYSNELILLKCFSIHYGRQFKGCGLQLLATVVCTVWKYLQFMICMWLVSCHQVGRMVDATTQTCSINLYTCIEIVRWWINDVRDHCWANTYAVKWKNSFCTSTATW